MFEQNRRCKARSLEMNLGAAEKRFIFLSLSLSQSGMLLTAFLQIGGGGGVLVEMAVVVIIDNGCLGRKESEVVGPVISG